MSAIDNKIPKPSEAPEKSGAFTFAQFSRYPISSGKPKARPRALIRLWCALTTPLATELVDLSDYFAGILLYRVITDAVCYYAHILEVPVPAEVFDTLRFAKVIQSIDLNRDARLGAIKIEYVSLRSYSLPCPLMLGP